MYAPQNRYCFIIDNKATEKFHKKMKILGKCFKNVIVSDVEFDVDGAGHNMVRSFLYCMRLLLKEPSWKYVTTLQVDMLFLSH